MGATGVMVGHPRFQERGESGINRRTSVSAGPRGPETEDAWGYKFCIGPQCTATESESTAKRYPGPSLDNRTQREWGCGPETIHRLDDLKLGEVMGGRMDFVCDLAVIFNK